MDFSWIKKIFKIKRDEEKESVSLTKPDTTFTNIREFKDLKKNEKNKVLEYFKKINLDNYEELVKYSNDLANLYKLEQEVLKQTIDRYSEYLLKANSCNDQDRIGFQQINIAKLAICEFGLIFNNIKNIRDELEYRYIAIDLFIKKFDKPNIFNRATRAEKIAYLTKKESLHNERDRIRISIRTADIVLCSTYNRIKTDQVTQKCYELNKISNNIIKANDNELYLSKLKKELGYLIQQVNNRLADSSYIIMDFTLEIKEKILNKLTKEKEELANKTKNKLLEHSLRGEIVILNMIWYELDKPYGKEYCSLPSFLDDKYLEELLKITANYLHQHEIYRYMHKDDYKIYLKEMTDIYNKYQNTPTMNWDSDYLERTINHYELDFENYLKTFINDIDQKEIDKVYDAINHLRWLYSLLTQDDDTDYYTKFMQYSNELLSKVEEKYGVKYEIKDLHTKKAQENQRYLFIKDHMYNEFIYLFDLLNGNIDNIKIYFPSQLVNNSFCCDFELFIKNLGITIGQNKLTFPEYKKEYFEYSLEDIFYTLKFLDAKNINLMKYDEDYLFEFKKRNINHFLHRRPNNGNITGDFTNFIATIKMNELEKQNDERILIVPNTISTPGFDSIRKKIIRSKYGKKECVYVPDDELLRFCISELVKQNSFKNIIAKESTISSFIESKKNYKKTIDYERYQKINEFYGALLLRQELLDSNPINIIEANEYKVFIVPDDTKYSELSTVLDQELKENNKTLKKELVS